MTADPSIDPAGFLHEHLAQAGPDLLRELMQGFIKTLLSADADSVRGAGYGITAVTPSGPTDATATGTAISTRGSAPLMSRSPSSGRAPTFPSGSSSDAAEPKPPSPRWSRPATCSGEHPAGRTRGCSPWASPGSRRPRSASWPASSTKLVRDFRERPLEAGPYTFVAADALTIKVREGGRVLQIAVMVASGVNADELDQRLPVPPFRRVRGTSQSCPEVTSIQARAGPQRPNHQSRWKEARAAMAIVTNAYPFVIGVDTHAARTHSQSFSPRPGRWSTARSSRQPALT